MLAHSGISSEFANQRGYETIVNSQLLKPLGFNQAQQKLGQGLLIPLLRADGTVSGYQFRPDTPRQHQNGKDRKYETPSRQRNVLDVPPGVGGWLDDPSFDLWITEGTKKADCGAIHGLCIVALSGVWNWCGTNDFGGKTVLADFHDIALNGRRVVLAFDGDAARNPDVFQAMCSLADWLKTKDARVEYLHLPDNGDSKVGLDDYLAEHSLSDLLKLVKNHPPVADGGKHVADEHRFKDAYIGQEIADTYLKREYIYTGSFGWMKFDSRRWTPISQPVVEDVVRRAVIDMLEKASNKNLGVHVLKPLAALLSASRIAAILRIIKGYLATDAEDFDAHPHLLNVKNGVVDLRNGNLRPHDPNLKLTKVTMVDYVKDAIHEDWNAALTALPEDVTHWLQMRFGQGITGHPVPDDKLVILKGSGENGKTTVVDGVRFALGSDYAVTLPDRVLLARNGDHPTEMMVLRGARLAFMEEFPELGHLNVKRLKDLHGVGQISARYCGKDTVFWEPSHTIFVTTNYLPRVDESDHGTWRRLALVPFPYKYVKPNKPITNENMERTGDPDLRTRLRNGRNGQHEAVLSWLVAGAVQWYRGEQTMPDEPQSVITATRKWRASADLLLRFFDDKIVFDPEAHVISTELYAVFADWLKSHGHVPWGDQNFSARLSQHSEISLRGVEKKQIRKNQNLSRNGYAFASTEPVPARYTAWAGIRFRRADDRGQDEPDQHKWKVVRGGKGL